MKKIFFEGFFSLMLIMIMNSCSEEKVTQQILGAGDCQKCSGWSWSNGVATPTQDQGHFQFEATVTGELSFSYKRLSGESGTCLIVTIGSKTYFNSGQYEGSYNYQYTSLGNVSAKEVVHFNGYQYSVKDIKIVGTATETNNVDDHQWDF